MNKSFGLLPESLQESLLWNMPLEHDTAVALTIKRIIDGYASNKNVLIIEEFMRNMNKYHLISRIDHLQARMQEELAALEKLRKSLNSE